VDQRSGAANGSGVTAITGIVFFPGTQDLATADHYNITGFRSYKAGSHPGCHQRNE
jgi:hypothetical protein